MIAAKPEHNQHRTMDEEAVNEGLVEILRRECLALGCGGIKGLGVMFRHLDHDYSKRITFEEFKDGISIFGMRLSNAYLYRLFRYLDRDKSGGIDFCEFMDKLRPPMNEIRKTVIDEAFECLDINKDNAVMLDDIQVVYAGNIKRHPKYISGEWTEEEALRNFLDSLDTPGCPDGKVTRQEFLNYYAGVSATIDDDCYFDLMMRSCYGLRPRGST